MLRPHWGSELAVEGAYTKEGGLTNKLKRTLRRVAEPRAASRDSSAEPGTRPLYLGDFSYLGALSCNFILELSRTLELYLGALSCNFILELSRTLELYLGALSCNFIPVFPIFFPHFRFYGVVSIHMCVRPCIHRKRLEMLPKMTFWRCEILVYVLVYGICMVGICMVGIAGRERSDSTHSSQSTQSTASQQSMTEADVYGVFVP